MITHAGHGLNFLTYSIVILRYLYMNSVPPEGPCGLSQQEGYACLQLSLCSCPLVPKTQHHLGHSKKPANQYCACMCACQHGSYL